MKLSSPGPVHCERVILVLLHVTRALQHDLLVTTSFTHIEVNLGWREHFSTAVSPVSPRTHQLTCVLRRGAAGAFASSAAACPTCSFGHPHAGGLLNLPTHGLYWHSWCLRMYFNKNYLVWYCLHKALISFVVLFCFLCAIFSPKEVLSHRFSCSSPELLRFVCFFLMFFPALWSLQNHVHSSVPSASFPPVIHRDCHLPSNDIQMEVPCCQANQC